jgi:protein involved in polysaccharide export with SLBB domain
MGEILKLIKYSERSDKDNIQLFRTSVHDRQKTMLMASLQSLQTAALTAKSGSSDEASLRKDEATMILTWIDRAKNIEPTGQVVIAQSNNKEDLLLENGDILNVPTKEGLVLVAGEVLFPNATAFNSKLSIQDYISNAGGYSQNADVTKLIIARADGSFSEIDNSSFFNGGNLFSSSDSKIKPGDHILVMPKIDVKSRQFFKEMTQIMYQLAVSAKIVLGI